MSFGMKWLETNSNFLKRLKIIYEKNFHLLNHSTLRMETFVKLISWSKEQS